MSKVLKKPLQSHNINGAPPANPMLPSPSQTNPSWLGEHLTLTKPGPLYFNSLNLLLKLLMFKSYLPYPSLLLPAIIIPASSTLLSHSQKFNAVSAFCSGN